MKLTNLTLLNSTKVLSILSQKELPIRVSFSIARNISKINDELKIYNDERQKLIMKYCEKDEDGKTIEDENKQIKLKDEYKQEWSKDMQELLSIENEIDIVKFSIDKIENVSIAPNEIIFISYMIEDI